MYNENNVKINIDWKSLILKVVLVILAILLIIWIFPMPKLDTFYNKVYNDNLNTMKEAAENYFTADKLPTNTGSSVTIKLQDMLDKKLVTNFTDKNNNTCNASNSYAQATKTENDNYVLKVQLACDEKTDYILENINTKNVINSNSNSNNNNNSNNNSNSNNTSSNESKNTLDKDNTDDGIEIDSSILDSTDSKYDKGASVEYEYKKAITRTNSTYVCPDGYVKDGNSCYRYETGEVFAATPLYFDDVVTENPAKKNTTGGYTKKTDAIKTIESETNMCPEGYTRNGNICYKYINATVVPGTTTYSCPENYVLNGTTCTLKISATGTTTEGGYSCPAGYTLSGTKCISTIDAEKVNHNGEAYYTCDRGGSLNGDKCFYNATYKNGTQSCKCPSGYSDNGSNCVKTVSYNGTYHAGTTTYGNCPSGFTPVSSTSNQCVKNANVTVNWSNPQVITSSSPMTEYNNGTTKVVKVSGPDCKLGKGCTYTYYKYTATKTYSCSSGSRSGDKCYTTRSVSTSNGYYTCNDGSKQNSATCYKKEYKNKECSTSKGSYTCPNNDKLVNTNQCRYNATYHKKGDTTTYKCPAGYTLNGTKCTKSINATKGGSSTSYSCPPGYSLNGKECIYTIAATPHTTETQYSCPAGYVREGTTCYQYTEPTTKRTYRYECPEGYTKQGEGESTICSKEVKSTTTYYCENADEILVGDVCRRVVKGGIKGYSCPSGYILDKDKCIGKTKESVPLQEITNITTTYEYMWSSESYVEGWTQTGKTRSTSVPVENLYEK